MKVAYVCQWSSRTSLAGPPGGIPNALRDAGLSVAVFTGPPYDIVNHALDDDSRWWTPGRSPVGGHPARQYPYFPGHSASTLRRVAMYSSFAVTSLASLRHLKQADVAVVYGSPATAATAPLLAQQLYSIPYVYIEQDVWPDSIFAAGYLRTGAAREAIHATASRFTMAVRRNARHILAISGSMRDLIISRGIESDKVSVMYNWVDESLISQPISVPDKAPTDPLRVMYAGNLGTAQRLDLVLDAIDKLPRDAVRLTLIGGGAAEQALRSQAKRLALTNVEFRGSTSRRGVYHALADAHLHLVSLGPEPVFTVTVPSKLQTLLAAGAPILSFAPGEVPSIVTESGAGIAARAGDPVDLAHQLYRATELESDFFAEAGKRASAHYLARMSREQGVKSLLSALDKAACRIGPAG